jgi:hypothetical protein
MGMSGQLHVPAVYPPPRETGPGTHGIGHWMGPRCGQVLPLLGIEPGFLGSPTRSVVAIRTTPSRAPHKRVHSPNNSGGEIKMFSRRLNITNPSRANSRVNMGWISNFSESVSVIRYGWLPEKTSLQESKSLSWIMPQSYILWLQNWNFESSPVVLV